MGCGGDGITAVNSPYNQVSAGDPPCNTELLPIMVTGVPLSIKSPRVMLPQGRLKALSTTYLAMKPSN